MAQDIFISHTTVDKDIAIELCESLEAEGLSCWIAPRNIEAAGNWTASIMKGIAECKIMALVFSSKSSASEHVSREIIHAMEIKRLIFPVRVENALPTGGLAYCLSGVQWFDATTAPLKRHMAALVERFRMLLSPQSLGAPLLRPGAVLAAPQMPVHEVAPSSQSAPLDIAPAAEAKIRSCLTEILGPLGAIFLSQAIAGSPTLEALHKELLGMIPSAKDQQAFQKCWGGLFPAKVVAQPRTGTPAPLPLDSPAGKDAVVEPAILEQIKVKFAEYVGPLAGILVDRAVTASGSAGELLDLLAAELDSPAERDQFLRETKVVKRRNP